MSVTEPRKADLNFLGEEKGAAGEGEFWTAVRGAWEDLGDTSGTGACWSSQSWRRRLEVSPCFG